MLNSADQNTLEDNYGKHSVLAMKHAEDILNMELELDIFRIMLQEERTSRTDLEERLASLSDDLNLTTEMLQSTRKLFKDATEELSEGKSVIEALESQQVLSINEVDDLHSSINFYKKLLLEKETEIVSLKKQLSRSTFTDVESADLVVGKDLPMQVRLKKMQDSLDKARQLTLWNQNVHELLSNEEEMDNISKQAEAETAEVIVCMQEELAILEKQVQDSQLKEIENKNNTEALEAKVEDLQKNLDLVTENNKKLVGLLEEKDRELKTLTEECKLLSHDIEELLANGNDALEIACDELGHLSTSFPLKRIWIAEQFSQIVRTISEKEFLVEELNGYLEDANCRRSDLECMLKSLRGAALAITEAHRQESSGKDREICSLTFELERRARQISKLEEMVEMAEHNLQNASTCATAAFIVVNRVSEVKLDYLKELQEKDIWLNELSERNIKSNILLSEQAATIEEYEEQISVLRKDLAEVENTCMKLNLKISEVQEIREQNEIMEARNKLHELKSGVSTLKSCMNAYLSEDSSRHKQNGEDSCISCHGNARSEKGSMKYCEERPQPVIEGLVSDDVDSSCKVGKTVPQIFCHLPMSDSEVIHKESTNKDVTIALLGREIESAFESLKHAQAEITLMHHEKRELAMSEKLHKERLSWLPSQLLAMEAAMSRFEEKSRVKIEVLESKLSSFWPILKDACSNCSKTKELLELEVAEAAVVATQKSEEAVYILAKFEEAQQTLKEADTMINKLVIANGTLKHDLERLENIEMSLLKERDELLNEVHDLQSVCSSEYQQYEILKDQIDMQIIETKYLFTEMGNILSQFHNHFKLQLSSLASDFDHTKLEVLNSTKKVKSWLEDVWSEIISRDCGVWCLHLCHMGILLETLTGLNTEKHFLEQGLQESNTILDGLREHNNKSMKELEICRNLRGKLLADIKNSFDRISMKEEETGKMMNKLNSFELNILDLQHQEELMLERSHRMGSELAILARELDLSNLNAVSSLMQKEEQLKTKEVVLCSKVDEFTLEVCWKDFELLISKHEMKEMATQLADLQKKNANYLATLRNLKKEIFLFKVDEDISEGLLLDYENDMSLLKNKLEDSKRDKQELLVQLEQRNSRILEMDTVVRTLAHDNEILKEVSGSNALLIATLSESEVTNMSLLNQIQSLEAKCREMHESLQMKDTALECSSGELAFLNEQNEKLQADIHLMQASLQKLQSELDRRDEDLCNMTISREEYNTLKMEKGKLEMQNSLVLQDLQQKKLEYQSSLSNAEVLSKELVELKDQISFLEAQVAHLETELYDTRQSKSSLTEEVKSKSHEAQAYIGMLQEENAILRTKLEGCEKGKQDFVNKCVKCVENMEMSNQRLYSTIESKEFMNPGRALGHIWEDMQQMSGLIEHVECFDNDVKDLISENSRLQSELLRKDDILEGLLFDLSLLQESASNVKDQKDEIGEMAATLETLEEELAAKSGEHAEAVERSQELERKLQEKVDIISSLELEMSKQCQRINVLSSENLDLEACFQRALEEESSAAEDLLEQRKAYESLEIELSEMVNAVDQMNKRIESLEYDLNELTLERDNVHCEVLTLRENLEKAQTLAHDNEAAALEARQRAEAIERYALDKEDEVKLLERSVEELERTVNVLENKVDIVKGEAERQCLLRQELELELHALKDQIQNLKDADAEMKRYLEEKTADLENIQKQNQILEVDIANKEIEIEQFKAHISELNLHAEAQASEYQQKFKELGAMAELVRPEGPFPPNTSQLTYKLEKNSSKPRGSGSPFKCIGLGLAQQMKSENDEELTSARKRIEELELVVVSKQKEIFALNAKLAAADSMTHDVIRDLLGVKLDMNSYVSMLDDHQTKKIVDNSHAQSSETELRDVIKLKKQLNEFVEERQGWLEEIDRKQAELIAVQVTLEKHRQHEQLMKAENEVLKMENATTKKKVLELEREISKLAGQQNLQQRIHHHAKIKEENNNLKIQNEDLATKLRRSEVILSRAKEELARHRASVGKNQYFHVAEDQQLRSELKETQEQRVELAEKLLSLCTKILKVAGFTKSSPEVCPSVAEEALEQLKNRIDFLESELQDVKTKHRTTRRASHVPFLSSLDR